MRMKKYQLLMIVCVIIAACFGITAAILQDAGGHKNLTDVCTAIAIISFMLLCFLWPRLIGDLLE